MTTTAANGRDLLRAKLISGEEFLLDGGKVSPIFYTMGVPGGIPGAAPSPIFSTQPAPIFTTQPAPVIGAAGTVAPVTTTTASTAPAPDDPLFELQWHFDWLGDIQKIWEEYTGAGVHVGVYDDGLQRTHPDLAPNYDASLHVYVSGQEMTPDQWQESLLLAGAKHGTAVAGLIAGANNGIGGVGVAYGASLTGVDILSGHDLSDINQNIWGFLEAATSSTNFDVVNHSWGNGAYFWQPSLNPDAGTMDQETIAAWMYALEYGRHVVRDDGTEFYLGTIQVKAAGNQNLNANGVSASSSRATITVGAYDDDGDASYYSNHGSNLLVSAPTSGNYWNAGLVTTDLSGVYDDGSFNYPYGYNGLPDLDYTNGFGGTSGATPIVTGVIALMLSANENLGWRDVQNILAYSAHEVGSGVGGTRTETEKHSWAYNGAENWNGGGLHFSNDYGFGGVNAYNAVRMTEVWTLFGGPKASANETSYTEWMFNPVAIEDAAVTEIKFTFSGDPLQVDFVNVELMMSHDSLYELDIYLISPNGTAIELVDFSNQYYVDVKSGWNATFGANAFRGEDGIGEWTIRIVDSWEDDNGTLDYARITLHGTDGALAINDLTSDVYHFTNEVFETLARDATRLELTDTDGGADWINAAALASNLVIRLAAGETSTADGQAFVRIAEGVEIENAVAGDGNDALHGNDGANKLYGMRGNDVLLGGVGNDTLSGGAGNDTLTGGAGEDIFLFDRALDVAGNIDIIADFSHDEDSIWLNTSIFSGLSVDEFGQIDESLFYIIGTGTLGEEDRILFDLGRGELYFDVDGSGTGSAAILFATFEIGSIPLDLSFNDFFVVSSAPGAPEYADDRPEGYDNVTASSTPIPPTHSGGLVIGTDFDETIVTKNDNDRIFAKGGNDIVVSGRGNDYVDGGEGADIIYGQDGDDWLVGGGSLSYREDQGPLLEPLGDQIVGGNGNDFIQGSNQRNDWSFFLSGIQDDYLIGDQGDDVVFGLDGDDFLHGDGDLPTNEEGETLYVGGNDILYGGAGSDYILGGFGDDRIYAGAGRQNYINGEYDNGFPAGVSQGVDTAVFDGNYDDYKFTAWLLNPTNELLMSRTTPGEVENTIFDWKSIEYLEFSDRTLDLRERPLVYVRDFWTNNPTAQEYPDVTLGPDGYEIAAVVKGANEINISDTGAETGGIDRFNALIAYFVTGDVTINSDAFGYLELGEVEGANNLHGRPEFHGSITISAAAGDRVLQINMGSVTLDAGEMLSDNTATEVVISHQGKYDFAIYANGALANDYNVSFAEAEEIYFKFNYGDVFLKWFVPKTTLIDMSAASAETVGFDDNTGAGNLDTVVIETALDDEAFATAGGSDEYRFIGWGGVEHIRLGNVGAANAATDGTVDGMQFANAGLGLRGHIELNGAMNNPKEGDEVRLLGSDAFQISTVTGQKGTIRAGDFEESGKDVIRMTFGVAAAIEDISDYISGFEYVQFDVTSQSHTVSTEKFDDLTKVQLRGYSDVAGENTVELLEGSTVVIKSVGLDDNFGTVHLNGSAAGLNLSFVDFWTEPQELVVTPFQPQENSLATGTINVRDATLVNITTDSRNDVVPASLGGWEPTVSLDSFGQVFDLDAATTVTLSGDTGWDFTLAGTDIGNVTALDASGVLGLGALGAVTAYAQTVDAVTFTGGRGDDTFRGNAGNDTLTGGQGYDTALFTGESTDYTFATVDGKLVVTDTRGVDGSDTLIGIEKMVFTDGTFGANEQLSGAPYDVKISSALVLENAASGTVVGTLTARDPDSVDTFTYSIVKDFADAFAMDGDKLVVTKGFNIDYESRSVMNVTVRATDASGKFIDTQISIAVQDVNPDIVTGDDANNVLRGGAGNDIIDGAGGEDYLNGSDGDDTITGGAGDDFIDGYNGVNTAVFSGNRGDYLITGNSASILQVTDLRQGSPDGTDVLYNSTFLRFADGTFKGEDLLDPPNTAPTVSLQNVLPSLPENTPTTAPVKVADIVITDDGNGVNTLGLTGADKDYFEIDGNALYLKAGTSLDFETKTHFDVAVTVDDTAVGGTPDASVSFSLAVTDANEAPTEIALAGGSVAEFADNGTVAGTLSATDPDSGETFTYELTGNPGGRFAISGNQIVVADSAGLDFEMEEAHEVTVKVTDAGGLSTEKTFSIAVTDVNEKATVSLANKTLSLAENTAIAAPLKVADIVVSDPDSKNAAFRQNALSLTGRDAALFEIVGMALFLKAGVVLDYETRQSLEVAVEVDDATIGSGPEGSASFALAITDVAEQPVILGTPGNNYLVGTNGDDLFDGRGGRDTYKGLRGDDTYVVDSSNDSVIERRHEGNDTVRSSASSYTLGDNVENLVLTGTGSIDGSGNSGDNVITGNSGNNRLYGGSGNDLIEGGDGNDIMDGGSGTDTASYEHAASGVTVSLAAWGAQNTGGAGFDTLWGFENLKGSAHADHLTGDRHGNAIKGGAGNDVIDGGAGNDTLSGGEGADAFVFSTALSSRGHWFWGYGTENRDTITDYSVADDAIWLDHDIFTALTGADGSALSAGQFWKGTAAHDADDRIIYNSQTGALIYDSNGNKAGGAIEFAVLSKGLAMDHSEFVIV